VDVTVSIPDDMRRRAKADGLNLSRLLRDALAAEFTRRDAVALLLDDPQTHELELMTPEGRMYTGRFRGRLIHEIEGRTYEALYLTDDGRMLFVEDYEYRELRGGPPEAADFLKTWLEDAPDQYVVACEQLGLKPVIDI
jgi:hypothetical protein